MLDREATARLLQNQGVTLPAGDLAAVCREAKGYPLALELLAMPDRSRRDGTPDMEFAVVPLPSLEPCCTACHRTIAGIRLHTLQAIARYRLNQPNWKADLSAALDAAREYGFVRTVSQFGTAVLPLFESCG